MLTVEYENEDFLVVNKPADLPVYSTKKHKAEYSVVSLLLAQYPELRGIGHPERPGVVHRLDKQTSGLLMVAKTKTGYDFLTAFLRSRQITKEYMALVYGELPKHGVMSEPLTKIGYRGQSRVRVDSQGKEALTEYWTKGFYHSGLDRYTLVRVKLHTGRTHQIRVHLAHIKHPVMGDNLYGKPNSQKLQDVLKRQFLHASRLEFRLIDGTWLEVESELPEDLQQVLQNLQKISNF